MDHGNNLGSNVLETTHSLAIIHFHLYAARQKTRRVLTVQLVVEIGPGKQDEKSTGEIGVLTISRAINAKEI
jgi:hypothetical protein